MSGQPAPAPPPAARVMELVTGFFLSQALRTAAELEIADHLAGGPLTTAELAAAAGAHEPSLYRLLRALASAGVFEHAGPRAFALNPAAETLRKGTPGSIRDMAIFQAMEFHWTPWAKLTHSVRTGESAFEAHHGRNFFEHCAGDPEANGAFNGAMTNFARTNHAMAARAYDFSVFGTIMDVGGGHGGLLASILKRTPGLRGIVFDLPHVVAGAPELLAREGVADRARAGGGSFFEDLPRDADAVVMSMILHDWDDERASAILSQCRKALPPEGKVLLVEHVIPEGPERHFGKLIDLEMLVSTPAGRERTEAEWEGLFRSAGFRLERVIDTAAPVKVIEAGVG